MPERTLRRAVQLGTVRCHRPGVRQLELEVDELTYLRENWNTISGVTEALRTERNVRLAVLFGSVARGHAGEDSDIDVLVSLAEERPLYLSHLATRLTRALDRDVDVLLLTHVRTHDPALLGAILNDGRPVIDRDRSWPALIATRGDVERATTIARAKRHRRTAHAVAQLIGA
ncbi:MAG: nucleotidyltransferase family protein [Solirubrobacteraceae bacterium]